MNDDDTRYAVKHLPTVTTPDGGEKATCHCDYDVIDPRCRPALYADIRRSEHSTLGDAADRFKRDPDAFTAGAQYALDSMIGASAIIHGITADWVESHAATILGRVHRGEL